MVKIKAVSGLVLLVKDPAVSADFYENLGFTVVKKEYDAASVRSNWFWIDFYKTPDFRSTGNDNQTIYMSVDDIDSVYEELKSRKLSPTEPHKFPTDRYETMISDPDGYKLVFFTKK